MINNELLDKICPLPDEENEMEEIRAELSKKGFKINNFNKGGIFYIIIRIFVTIYIEIITLARSIINNSFVTHAEEDWLEIKAADYGKNRKEAMKAQGYITLYRDDYSQALQITKGHMFKTLPDINGQELKYYVLNTTVIPAGVAIGKVLVEAEESGIRYNLSANQITISMIHLDGVESMTNEEGWLYLEGTDIEPLEDFRERIKESWSELAELTTDDKIKNVARKVDGVLDVKIDSQHPRGQGTADIIITSVNGAASEELLKRVESATSYLKGNYDDFLYKSSTIEYQDISLELYIAKDTSSDGLQELAETKIREIMDISKRDELNCVYLDDIRYLLKQEIPNYKRAIFKTPLSDIELENNKVIMLGNLEVIIKNVGGD